MSARREGTFQGSGKLNLYYQSWHPGGQVRAILAIVPGLGGHSGAFGHVVDRLLPKNYAIYGFDLRGNGRSPGQRGYINNWAEFRQDLQAFLELIERQHPGIPLFLLGHSLGGAIVLDYLLRSPAAKVRGAIALAPTLGKVGVSPLKAFLGRLLSQICPHFTLDTGIDRDAGSRDPVVADADARDPLRHARVSARLATEYFAIVDWIQERAIDWQVPLLILHGTADRVAMPSESRRFFEAVTFADKELREYPGAYHELQNDLNYQEVLADLEDWLERHLA